VVFLGALSLCACSRGLGAGEEKVDLTSHGLNASVQVPVGGKVDKGSSGRSVEVRWGDHGDNGLLDLSPGTTELKCTVLEDDCKVLESDAISAIVQYKSSGKDRLMAKANVPFGGATLRCVGYAYSPEDARRLLAACKSVTSTGAADSAAPTARAAAPAPAPAAAPPVLEEQTFEEKAKGLRYTVRVPKGWTGTPISGGGHMFVEPAAKGSAPSSQITLTPFVAVKTLEDAEKEFKRADVAGLDTIADKRALGPKSFLVATAPRGTGKMMSVNVYASGAKSAVVARCAGPASAKATLEEVCSSLKVD
jgi:hypothetical protein